MHAKGARIGRVMVGAALLLSLAGHAVSGPITIEIFPSIAPNAFGSPSFSGYAANAQTGLQSGVTSVGNPALPTFYSTVSQITASQIVVTNFPSWLGQANPGAAFGAAFASELGSRLHFGLHVNGNGTQFSLSQLSFAMHS